MRAPGMTLFRMPILTWNLWLSSFMVVLAFPVLTGALIMLLADREFGAQFFEPQLGGTPILFQHLFWFFGHPEVYIIALPFFGVVSEVIPVFSRRPLFGYKGIILATLAIDRAVDIGVGAPHVHDRCRGAAVLRRHDVPHRRADWRQGVQLDRHDVGRLAHVPAADAVLAGFPRHVRDRRPERCDPRLADARLPPPRLVLRRRPLPLRHGRHGRVRAVRRDLLLVAEGDRPLPVADARGDSFLAAADRLPHDVLRDAPDGLPGATAPGRRLSGDRHLRALERDRHRRVRDPGPVDGSVRDRHRPLVAPAADRRRRPVARQLARVVDDVAAATPQLRVAATDPLRAPDVRLSLDQ